MNFDFNNKKVLVTGGTRGIGAKVAEKFSEAGADVTVTATNRKSFDAFIQETSTKNIKFISADFADLNSTLTLAETIGSQSFDILVNNAGINKIDTFDQVQLDDWQRIQDVNLRAPFLISQAAAKPMAQKKWGRIINISSIFGMVTKEKRLAYTTSKSGLIGMTKNMALELAPHNVLVNSISPGFIDTDLTRAILSEAELNKLIHQVPLKKLGQPSDIAYLALFIASDFNQFMTGENIVIDGGFTNA